MQPLSVPSPLPLLPFAPTALASHVGTSRDNSNTVYATSSAAALAAASPMATAMAAAAAGLQPPHIRLAMHPASTEPVQGRTLSNAVNNGNNDNDVEDDDNDHDDKDNPASRA
jgi:hypothetical protein